MYLILKVLKGNYCYAKVVRGSRSLAVKRAKSLLGKTKSITCIERR